MAKRNHGGIVTDAIVPGEFYIAETQGGWGDKTTGIFIPGFVADMAKDGSGEMLGVYEMADPVQLPHSKRVVDAQSKDSRKIGEATIVPFDRVDEFPLHDALNLALSTGNIRHVPQEEMEERWPEVWAKRETNKIFDGINRDRKGIKDMISEHFDNWDANKKLKAMRKKQAEHKSEVADKANAALVTAGSPAEEFTENIPRKTRKTKTTLPPPPVL